MINFPHTAIIMARKYLSVSGKLEILKAETTGNVSATAREHSVQPNQIQNWPKNYQKLIAKKSKLQGENSALRCKCTSSSIAEKIYTRITEQCEKRFCGIHIGHYLQIVANLSQFQ